MNKVWLVAGARGVGKTDFLKEVIRKSTQPKKLITDTFDSPVWHTMQSHSDPEGINTTIPFVHPDRAAMISPGIWRTYTSDFDALNARINARLRNSLVIYEDSTKHLRGGRVSSTQYQFVLDSKQSGNDLVFVFHSLAQIPPDLIRAADVLTLFKTNEGYPSSSKYPWGEIPVMMDRLKADENRFAKITIQLN